MDISKGFYQRTVKDIDFFQFRLLCLNRVPPQRPGFHQVLPDDVIRKSIKRKTIPKSLVVKQGYLDKRGNAKVKVWNEYVKL